MIRFFNYSLSMMAPIGRRDDRNIIFNSLFSIGLLFVTLRWRRGRLFRSAKLVSLNEHFKVIRMESLDVCSLNNPAFKWTPLIAGLLSTSGDTWLLKHVLSLSFRSHSVCLGTSIITNRSNLKIERLLSLMTIVRQFLLRINIYRILLTV